MPETPPFPDTRPDTPVSPPAKVTEAPSTPSRVDGPATMDRRGHERQALVEHAGNELLDDGQEEVFSYSAVERGLVKDPKALGPETGEDLCAKGEPSRSAST